MGTEAVVVVEWVIHVLVDLPQSWIQYAILIRKYESAEAIEA